jgi:hypothetical protein
MKTDELEDDLRPEYRLEDLGPIERGKHFAAYQKGTNLVLLRPEVAAAFPTAEAVNQALLGLIELGRKLGPPQRPSRPRRPGARRPAEPR